jgi:hypothetical protein
MSELEQQMRERAARMVANNCNYPALESLATGGRPGRQWLRDQIKAYLTIENLNDAERQSVNLVLDWINGLPSEWWSRNMKDDEKAKAVQEDLVGEAMKIAEWWVDTAKADAERTVPKAVEYGSADFDLMGQFMVALLGDRLAGADTDEKMRVGREMAVLFYMIGKLGRAVGAYTQGVMPSDDTIFDTRIYAMMWQRIRETGTWVQG